MTSLILKLFLLVGIISCSQASSAPPAEEPYLANLSEKAVTNDFDDLDASVDRNSEESTGESGSEDESDENDNKNDSFENTEDLGEQIEDEFNSCLAMRRVYNFKTERCDNSKTFLDCSYNDVSAGRFSDDIDTDSFSELINSNYLIQCYRQSGKKIVQAVLIERRSSGNINLKISCWHSHQSTCNY